MSRVIPESVKHAEFLVAIKPLLDLLQVEANEILSDIHITSDHGEGLSRISLLVIPRNPADGDDYPKGRSTYAEDSIPGVHENSEWVVPVTVKVVL